MDTIMATNLIDIFSLRLYRNFLTYPVCQIWLLFIISENISSFLASDITAWSMGLNRESLEISHNLDLGPYVHKEPHLAQSGGSLHLIVPILPYGYRILGLTYNWC